MKKVLSGMLTLGVATLLLSSCAKVPQAEIDSSKAAISEAIAAGADIYATESLVVLQDSMKAVLEGIEAEKASFFANYDAAKSSLASVTQLAADVKVQAETKKAELKTQLETTIVEATALVQADKDLILQAPKGKEGSSALVAIQGELTVIETTITESQALLDSGDLMADQDKANAAKEKATAINVELTDVIAKYKSNKK